MKFITERKFRDNSAAVMDAVEAGETCHVTRKGVEVAEVASHRTQAASDRRGVG